MVILTGTRDEDEGIFGRLQFSLSYNEWQEMGFRKHKGLRKMGHCKPH